METRFVQALAEAVEGVLDDLEPDVAEDLYAIRLMLSGEDDDLRRPSLSLYANTLANLGPHGTPTWLVAEWLGPADGFPVTILGQTSDVDSAEELLGLRDAWIRESPYYYDDETWKGWQPSPEGRAGRARHVDGLAESVMGVSVLAAQELHEEGVLRGTAGDDLVVILDQCDQYDRVRARWAKAANPPGVADPYLEWLRRTSTESIED